MRGSFLSYLTLMFLFTTVCVCCVFRSRDDSKNNNETGGVCFAGLGCFPLSNDFFHLLLRPLNSAPQHPDEINTTFWLYTRKNPDKPVTISRFDKESIDNSNFDGTKPVIFIIHGFTSGHESNKEMVDALLKNKESNVIAVDWSIGATFPYTVAVANTRLVGRQIGNLIVYLKDNYNVNLDDVHLIGHSLGAQLAGYAGQWLNGSLGRISGLDPASIFFEGLPENVILDLTDAKFVDVLHSDSHPVPYIGAGIAAAHGHFDFYPDGGRNIKSCGNILKGIGTILQQGLDGIKSIISCSHSMAVTLYVQSINGDCPFTAYTCDSIRSYEDAKCMTCDKPGRDCAQMGYHSVEYFDGTNNHNNFYLTTSDDDSKACVYHWVMEIESYAKNHVDQNIDIHIEVKAEHGHMDDTVYKSVHLRPGKTYRHLLEYPDHPGKIKSLVFSWDTTRRRGGSEKIFIKKITLIPIDIIDKSERKKRTIQFCGEELEKGVEKSTKVTLTPKTECPNEEN